MLGSIEELEKDIELFQQNMAASGEMQTLLKQMIEQIKQQNTEFAVQYSDLLSRVDNLPLKIENANDLSNTKVKEDVTAEIDRALQSFADEQNKYLQAIEDLKQQIEVLMRQFNAQEKKFSDGVASALEKFNESAQKIVDDNSVANAAIKDDIDNILAKRNAIFAEEQNKYIAELHQTQEKVENCEGQLTAKYTEFISTLQKMNISNLYDQNVQLKTELNKRTTILMIISAVSIVVGIIGIFI